MPINTNTTKVRGFAGLVNTVEPEELSAADRSKFPLLKAKNVFLTNARRLKSRPGFVLSTAGSYHSLWSGGGENLVVSDNELLALDEALAETSLHSGLTPNARMSYAYAGDRVFYMNSTGERGMVKDGVRSPWGIPNPSIGVATTTTGAMPGGTYQIGITQRLASGEESGLSRFAQITLSDGEGITVHLPTPDPDAAEFTVYCSQAGGKNLYQAARVAYTATTVTITSTTSFGQLLKTEDVIEPPVGSQIMYHFGRMYVVVGNHLYYSDALAPGWFRENQFFSFPDAISLTAAVDGGIFVSSDRTYFLAGTDPKQMSQKMVSDAQAVSGTLEYLQVGDAADVQIENAAWISNRGFVLGSPTGGHTLLTEDDFTFAVSGEGSLSLVKQEGVSTLVGLMESPNDDTNDFGISDRVSAEVIRNSVV